MRLANAVNGHVIQRDISFIIYVGDIFSFLEINVGGGLKCRAVGSNVKDFVDDMRTREDSRLELLLRASMGIDKSIYQLEREVVCRFFADELNQI